MDNKKEFKNFLHALLALVLVFVCVVASAGCISFGAEGKNSLYIGAGVLNLGWIYPVIRQLVKFIKKSQEDEVKE